MNSGVDARVDNGDSDNSVRRSHLGSSASGHNAMCALMFFFVLVVLRNGGCEGGAQVAGPSVAPAR